MASASPFDTPSDRQEGSYGGADIRHDLARLVERLHRRYLDVIRLELSKADIIDVSPVQALMALTIGEEAMTAQSLVQRGYYLGANASLNLKVLVEGGYVDWQAEVPGEKPRLLALSEKGRRLLALLRHSEANRMAALARSETEARDVETTYRTLSRLERTWADVIRYDAIDHA
jgi:DNA-binding MarR family transcriptional regulator